jgi:hypothetical protein
MIGRFKLKRVLGKKLPAQKELKQLLSPAGRHRLINQDLEILHELGRLLQWKFTRQSTRQQARIDLAPITKTVRR